MCLFSKGIIKMTIHSPRDAIQLFSDAQGMDMFISHNLKETTQNQKDSATLDEISQLAKIAIEELDKQRIEGTELCGKLKEQVDVVKNYLFKKINHFQSEDAFSNLAEMINKEINQLDQEQSIIDKAKKDVSDGGEKTSKNIDSYYIRNRAELVEIAKWAAQKQGSKISQYIRNYGIDNQNFLVKVAGLAALSFGWETEEATDFVKNQKALIEIAKLAAQTDPYGTSQHIKNYGIINQEALIEIAKLAAQQSGWGIARYIQNYGIKDQAVLIEIAKLCAQQNGGETSEFIKNFGIKDKTALIEIAKLTAGSINISSERRISAFIQNYGIKDQAVLIEIAKRAAQKNGMDTSEFIKNYGINDQKALIEIAKIAAKQNGWGTSESIKNYGITDKAALVEIAKLAIQDGQSSKHIQNYGIKDQAALIEIAKMAAKSGGQETCAFIQDYGIKDQAALVEIAKLTAQSGISSPHIQNFGIKDQASLIEIAKLAAGYSGEGVSEYIQSYGIKDQGALVEIAKLAAQQDGRTSVYIDKYGIEDQADLIEIAKFAANRNSSAASRFIQKYGIKEQSGLIQIAKLAAQQEGSEVSRYIQNYGIKDRAALIEIAKLAARNNGERTSTDIQNYGITEQSALVEIAKLAAQNDGRTTSQFINNYGITDQSALVEIAKLAAKQNGNSTSYFIQNYDIADPSDRLEILCIDCKSNPFASLQDIKRYNLPLEEWSELTVRSTLSDVQNAFKWPEEFSPLFKELSQSALKPEDREFLVYLGLKFKIKPPCLKDTSVWNSILQYKDNRMRCELADAFFALDERQAKFYAGVTFPEFLKLPALIFCLSSTTEKDANRFYEILNRKEFRDGIMHKVLLDTVYLLINSYHFTSDESLSLLDKALKGKNIKANLFSIQGTLNCGGEDDLRKQAQKDDPDFDAAYEAAFARTIPIKTHSNFADKYERTFERTALPTAPLIYAGKLRQLNKTDQEIALAVFASFIDTVLEGDYHKRRYENSAHLAAIFENQPALQKIWPDDVEKPLADYLVESGKISFDPQKFLKDKLLNFTHLPRERYEILYKFLEAEPEKAQSIVKEMNETLADLAKSSSKNIRRESDLRKALVHLGEIEGDNSDKKIQAQQMLKFLAKQLKDKIPEELSKLDRSNTEFIKIVEVHVAQFKKVAEEELLKLKSGDEGRQKLLLQKDIIDLYRSQQAPLAQRLNQLVKIQAKLGELDKGVEFLNDVNGMVKALSTQKQSYEGYKIVNTDRFDLMLLCGTQVQGSCQRIDGDPELNKCLLAYLMDGKHRLIAIKDGEGKEAKIVARSIFRLLWDKEQKRPALMLEWVYSNVPDDSLTKAVNAFAGEQARRMGLDCYVTNENGNAQLESLDCGVAPWEYVDSAGGVKPRGRYTVTKAVKLTL